MSRHTAATTAGGKAMYTLYSMQRSGNSYKVRLALAQLGIPFRLVEIDILKGESRTPEFLATNPHRQWPLLARTPHPQRPAPPPRVPGQKSARPGAAPRSRARPLSRRIERDPLAPREPHAVA